MQITTRLLCFVVLLSLLGIPSRAGNPTIPEKNNLWNSPPTGCELPAPGNVQVTALGPDFADLDWDDVPGASGYQAVLTDLTVSPNISISTNTTSSNISYNASLITPGHTYRFEVASICANNQIGASTDLVVCANRSNFKPISMPRCDEGGVIGNVAARGIR